MFGLSIGDTDKDWWNHIANAILNKNSKLIIFAYSENDVNGLFGFDKEEISDNIVKRFTDKLSLDAEKIEKLKENIFVSINSGIFNIKLSKNIIDIEFSSKHALNTLKTAFDKTKNKNSKTNKVAKNS